MPRKKVPKWVPDHLKPLARDDQRIRFNGFWLGPKERDRVIAEWMEQQPDIAQAVKTILYLVITGRMSMSGAPLESAYDYSDPDHDEFGAVESSLLDFDD